MEYAGKYHLDQTSKIIKILYRKLRRPMSNKAEVELMYLGIRDMILGAGSQTVHIYNQ